MASVSAPSGNLVATMAVMAINPDGTPAGQSPVATTATQSNVASSGTSVTLAAANANRKTILIANDSTAVLYISLAGGAASTTNYSLALGPVASSIAPVATINNYTGAITGIWASANGFARVTELA